MRFLRPRLLLPFIAFAIAVTLTHVCVLPGHAHASAFAGEGHGEDAPAHDHRGERPDGLPHGESCDVVRPAGSMPASPLLVAVASDMTFVPCGMPAVDRAADSAVPRASPPRYLVHRALLL